MPSFPCAAHLLHQVDMQDKFFAYTMDSVMKIFYGREVDTMAGAKDVYAEAYDVAHRSMLLYVVSSLRFAAMDHPEPELNHSFRCFLPAAAYIAAHRRSHARV